jgi:hypothetical protein
MVGAAAVAYLLGRLFTSALILYSGFIFHSFEG